MTIRFPITLLVFLAALSLSGCDFDGSADAGKATTSVDQSRMCIASTDQEALQCPDGQLIYARLATHDASTQPLRLLNTIAVYCNTNDQIIQNSAGVICTLTKARLDQFTSHGGAPSRNNLPQGNTPSNDR